jgi:hypothetical protein
LCTEGFGVPASSPSMSRIPIMNFYSELGSSRDSSMLRVP